uniref:Uncharacterized protein n=1 Tax=Schistocephalus solidus TaxID=70667 RepID=A0A0X3NJ00_SCHSO
MRAYPYCFSFSRAEQLQKLRFAWLPRHLLKPLSGCSHFCHLTFFACPYPLSDLYWNPFLPPDPRICRYFNIWRGWQFEFAMLAADCCLQGGHSPKLPRVC